MRSVEPPAGYPAGRDAHSEADQHGHHIAHPEHHARAYTTVGLKAGVRRVRELERGGAMSYFLGRLIACEFAGHSGRFAAIGSLSDLEDLL
jgi:hypothetical protein